MSRPTFIALASMVALAAAGFSPVGPNRQSATPTVPTKRLSLAAPPAAASVSSVPSPNEQHADLARVQVVTRQASEPRKAIASETTRTTRLEPSVIEPRSVNTPPISAIPCDPQPAIAQGKRPLMLAGRTGSGTWVVHGRTSIVTCRFSFNGLVAWRGPAETVYGGWSQQGAVVNIQAGSTSATGTLDGNRLVLRCHTTGVGDGVATLTFD